MVYNESEYKKKISQGEFGISFSIWKHHIGLRKCF